MTDNVVLTSADGKFLCTAEHAVEVAYMMSCAESAYDKKELSRFDLGEIMGDYVSGNVSTDEAIATINGDDLVSDIETDFDVDIHTM